MIFYRIVFIELIGVLLDLKWIEVIDEFLLSNRDICKGDWCYNNI